MEFITILDALLLERLLGLKPRVAVEDPQRVGVQESEMFAEGKLEMEGADSGADLGLAGLRIDGIL